MKKNLLIVMLFLTGYYAFAQIPFEPGEKSSCVLFLSRSSPVISQRTAMQDRLTLWHSKVGSMLKSEAEMKKDSTPQEAKNWMKLMLTDGLDFAHPAPLTVLWDNVGEKKKMCVVQISEKRDFTAENMFFYPLKGKNSAALHSMKSAQKYFLRLLWQENGKKKHSQTLSFTTKEEHPRWIHIEGLSNVRDFGGWKTLSGKKIRQGLLFRGPEMNGRINFTEEGKRMLLENLRIRTDIDLRGPESKRRPKSGTPALPENRVKHIRFSLGAYGSLFAPKQKKMYAEIFRILHKKENLPAYIHCVGGADRTGTIIFMLQGLLGVPEEDMLKDYELTSMFAAYRGIRYRGRKAFMAFRKILKEKTKEENLHKQCEKYFLDCGVTSEEIASFRKLFTE